MPTNFPQKKYKDKLYYHEVNSIFKAINDIEAAININVGTSNARIPSANIESLDAQKIFGTAALDSLTVGSLRVSEQTELDGQISLGENGTLSLRNNAGIETIKMGLLELGEDPVYGFRVSDGLNTNFLADEEGNVSVRGKIVAINGSEFTGKVNIITGTVIDNLKVGNGVLLDGNTGEIIAGGSRITKDGIDFSHGAITLQNLTIDGQGNLVASNVDLSGKFTITDGEIYLNQGELGGVTITGTGLTAGTVAPSSPYFVLSKTGGANINHGVFTGEAHLTSGTIDGEVVVDGALIAPGVVFDENGPTFSNMSVSLNDGLFVLQNGRLTASHVDLTGVFKVNSGEILGKVNIGSIVVDGESKKVIAGTNELQEDKFLFSSGVIDFGDNFNVSSTNGILHVKNAELEGKFEGEINVASGVVGGFEIGESILYSPADNPEYSMLILDSQGKMTVFQDRVAYGAGHKEDIVLDISQDGLLVDHGKVLIRTAIDGSKEVRVDVSGVRAIRSSQDEVIITGDGIKLKKDGEVSAPLISPDGFNAEFLEDGTITSNKLFQIKPSPVSFVVGEGRLVQTDGSDYGELTIKWPIVETRMDGSPADDIAGYRVYLFGGEYETFQCVGVVGPEPDFPDAAPGSELYNLKIFKQKVEKDTLYDFAVIAFDRLGNESYQTLGNAYVTGDNTVPGAPEFVHIYPGLYFLKVEWELSKAIDFKHFVVEKMVEGGEWEALPDTLSNHFLDKNVQHGVFYKYRVSVVDRSGNMSEYTESQWEAPLGVRASDLEDGSIISEKLAEDIYLQGFLTIGDGAILVPNEGVRMVDEEDQEEPVPHVFPIEYLRILEDNMDQENPIPKGIDVKNILIRNGEIILPDGTDTLVVHGDGETPELKDLSVRNISVSLINGIDLPELKASFDQHVVDFGDYQSQVSNKFDQYKSDFDDRVAEVDARFDGIDASIVNINTDIGEINDELAQINLRIDNIDTAIIGINNDIGDINNELVQIDQEIDNINTAIGNIGGDIGTISEDIVQVNARIDNEVSQINLRIDDIDAVISSLDDTIDTRFDTKIEPVITELNDKLDAKVDKVEGKGLSTEDFTTELKEKLESDDISVNNIYTNIPHEGTIGTADAPFASIYADEIHTSGNTLWVGDTPVLGTDDTTIIVRSDPGQNLKIMSYDGTELVATGLNADVKLQATGAGGRVVMGSDTEIRMTAPQTVVSGSLTVTGDMVVNGDSFVVKTETVEVKDNIIVLNKGQVGSGVSAGLAGIKVDRGDAPDYMIVFDEEEDMFKVGMLGDLETIASQNYVQSQLESFEFEPHPETHPASMIEQDPEHRFVTDEEKERWNSAKALEALPIGAVIPFAGNQEIPSGFFICDGRELEIDAFQELYAIVGDTYGEPSDETRFKLPDLRGEFIRGWDAGKGIDPGREFGSSQLDQMQRIVGEAGRGSNVNIFIPEETSGAFSIKRQGNAGISTSSGPAGGTGFKFDSANSPDARTGDETRPRNVALTYIIKAKNVVSLDPVVKDADTLGGIPAEEFIEAKDYLNISKPPIAIQKGDVYFPFENSLYSTQGIKPLTGYVATLLPEGGVAVTEGTTNLVTDQSFWSIRTGAIVTRELVTSGQWAGWYRVHVTRVGTSFGISRTQYIDIPIGSTHSYSVEMYSESGKIYPHIWGSAYAGKMIHVGGNRYVHTWTNNQEASGHMGIWFRHDDLSEADVDEVFYYRYVQIEAKPYDTPFVEGTRPDGSLSYDLPISINGDWTIAKWIELEPYFMDKTLSGDNPIGKYRLPLLELGEKYHTEGYGVIGVYGAWEPNRPGNTINIMANKDTDRVYSSMPDTITLTEAEYNNKILAVLTKSGSMLTAYIYTVGNKYVLTCNIASLGDISQITPRLNYHTVTTSNKMYSKRHLNTLVCPYAVSPETVATWHSSDTSFYDFSENPLVFNSIIVEEGSNENGWYIRWENGIQMCGHRVSLVFTTTDVQRWSYPASFTQVYFGTCSPLNYGIDNGYRDALSSLVLWARQAEWAIRLGKTSTVFYPDVGLFVIGRWK